MLEQSFGVKTRRENVQPVFLNYMKFSSFVQSVRIHDPFLTKNGNQRPMYYISLMLLFRRTELSRFKPAVGYCLPVTTFSDKQCNNIQSPFYQVALPKSGMNRHMPKAVIHRPTRYGGLNYMDLATEQIASHVSHLIGNLRRNDLVGKTIQAMIDAYQIYLGTERHFFLQVHNNFLIDQDLAHSH
jgi:hypothetical protein